MHPFTQPLALLALTSTVSAVSLSQFPPGVSNLSIPCQIVYKQDITGCAATDFTSQQCSTGCIRALQALTPAVKLACGNQNISGQNIIVAFLADAGPQSICPNANAVLGSGGSASSTDASSSTTTSASSSVSHTSGTSSSRSSGSSSTTTAQSGTTTSSPAMSTASVEPVPSPTSAGTSSTASATASSTSSSSQSGANDGSGGGSPFDTEGNDKSAASALTSSVVVASVVTLCALVMVVL